MPNPWKIPVTKYVQLNHNHNNTGNKAHQNSVIHSIRQSSCCPAALTLSSRTLTFPNTSLPYWIASDVSTQQMEWQCSVDPFVVNEFCLADQWFSIGFTGPWLKSNHNWFVLLHLLNHISDHSIMGMRMLLITSGHQAACLVLLHQAASTLSWTCYTHKFPKDVQAPSLSDLGTEVSSMTVHIVGAPGALTGYTCYSVGSTEESKNWNWISCPCLTMSAVAPG